MGSPMVSVIIPTYNRAHLLRRAISSVLAQTYRNWELIVVDDGSTDNTQGVMNDVCDPRIVCLCYEQNRGGSAARNAGIGVAGGKYIAFLDSDDEWKPTYLATQVGLLEHCPPTVGAVYSGALFVDDVSGRVRVKWANERGNIYRRILETNPPGGASRVMVRKKCLDRIGLFDQELPPCEDWDLWLRLSAVYEFECVPEFLVIYHEHAGSISVNPVGLIAGREAFWRKHSIMSLDSRLQGIHYFLLGHRLAYTGNTSMGRHYLWAAWVKAPICCRYILSWMASFLGPKAYRELTYRVHSHSPAAYGARNSD